MSFNSSLQLVADNTTLRGRTTPGVDGNVRCFGRVAFVGRAVEWIRRKEKFHALDVPRRCAVTLIHVTATDPFCAGRHSNLVGAAIVADRRASRVRAVEEIITRLLRIIPARIAYAVVNGVVPVKIVIGVDAVPASVVRLERVMRPANTGVGAGNHDGFPLEPERPDIGRMRIGNARLDRLRGAGLQWRFLDWTRLRKVIVNMRIACDSRHVRATRQCVGDLSSAFHQNCVNDIKRLMLDAAVA